MITINLLPPEYRKKERTPLVILLPILGGLICVLSAGAVAAYVHFVSLAETVNEREILAQNLNQKKPQLVYETNLLAEEAEYQKRAETISSIASGRILMTRKLDEMCDIVTQGDDRLSDGYLLWVKDFKTSPPRAQARARKGTSMPGGEIALKGFAVADHDPLQDYNRAHAAIKNSEMFRYGFDEMTDPSGKIQNFNDEKVPRKGWTIDLKMTLKNPEEARKLREQDRLRAEKEDSGK